MNSLTQIFVNRPVFTWVLSLALVVVGVVSLGRLGVERYPDVRFPIVVVSTVLPGASPTQVEREVTDKIEEAVNSVSSLQTLSSDSTEGLSVVIAEFALGTNVDTAAQQVRDHVNRMVASLPPQARLPQVETFDPNASPIAYISVTGNRTLRELTEIADKTIRSRLQTLKGVGDVALLGGRARQIHIELDLQALERHQLTPLDVRQALLREHIEAPGGDAQFGRETRRIRVKARLQSVRDIESISLVAQGTSSVVLRDVARVRDTEAPPSSFALLDGNETILLAIRKQSGGNLIQCMDSVRDELEQMRGVLPPDVHVQVVRDESSFVRASLHSVKEHLVVGALCAALVVLVFLKSVRSMAIAALAIPTSVLGTFFVLRVLGLTLDMLTLLALTLAVGIVIDDAIVVVENVVRVLQKHALDPATAAVQATREIGLAVLATTLSLVAVFLPVAFMDGMIGLFFRSFGVTMSAAIMLSLVVAFTLTPMLAARWLKSHAMHNTTSEARAEESAESTPALDDRAIYSAWSRGDRRNAHTGGLERVYGRVLAWCMNRRWLIGLAMLASLVAVVPLGAAVPKNFVPVEDEGRFEINLIAPEGTSAAQTSLIAERIARDTRALEGVSFTVNTAGGDSTSSATRGTNRATIFVALVPDEQRDASQQDIMQRVRTQILPHFAAERLRVTIASPDSGAGSGSIQFSLRGPNLQTLSRYAQILLERARALPGTTDHDLSFSLGLPELSLQLVRDRAADLNVHADDLAQTLQTLAGTAPVTSLEREGTSFDVFLLAEGSVSKQPEKLLQTLIRTQDGRLVHVADVANLSRDVGPSSIQHRGRQRQITLTLNPLPDASEQAISEALQAAITDLHLPSGYRAEMEGNAKELERASVSFLTAVLLSFVFMYLVLAAQFESWIHPITILVSLPLTVPFVLVSLLLFHQSLNLFSALGILVLFGIVKKNAILQVDHMQALRNKGMPRAQAVIIANQERLRPILMTTFAFVVGMVPLLLSHGPGSGTNHTIGVAVMGGQTLALALTLVATPVLYTWFDDIANARWVNRIGTALSKLTSRWK